MLTTYALSGLALASVVLAGQCPQNACTDALQSYGKAADFCAKYENHKKIQPAKVSGSCESSGTCVCPPSSTFPYPETLQPCFDDSTMADIEAACTYCSFPAGSSGPSGSGSNAPTSPAQSGLNSQGALSPSNTQGAGGPGQGGNSPTNGANSPSNTEGSNGPGSSNGRPGASNSPGAGSLPSNTEGAGSPGSQSTTCSPSMTTITYSDTSCGCTKTTTVPIVSTVGSSMSASCVSQPPKKQNTDLPFFLNFF